jgi:hypothetical protein
VTTVKITGPAFAVSNVAPTLGQFGLDTVPVSVRPTQEIPFTNRAAADAWVEQARVAAQPDVSFEIA